MPITKRHRVEFTAHRKVKEQVEVSFTTKSGKPVDFKAREPVVEDVDVSFLARQQEETLK
jgi:hypothetical protein